MKVTQAGKGVAADRHNAIVQELMTNSRFSELLKNAGTYAQQMVVLESMVTAALGIAVSLAKANKKNPQEMVAVLLEAAKKRYRELQI